MSKIELKIEEIPQAYVGKGVAIVDPKIIEEIAGNPDKFWNYFQRKKSM